MLLNQEYCTSLHINLALDYIHLYLCLQPTARPQCAWISAPLPHLSMMLAAAKYWCKWSKHPRNHFLFFSVYNEAMPFTPTIFHPIYPRFLIKTKIYQTHKDQNHRLSAGTRAQTWETCILLLLRPWHKSLSSIIGWLLTSAEEGFKKNMILPSPFLPNHYIIHMIENAPYN